jgi:hypothetical protein
MTVGCGRGADATSSAGGQRDANSDWSKPEGVPALTMLMPKMTHAWVGI